MSYARSTSSSSRLSIVSKHERTAGDGYKQGDDILDQRSSLEYGIFGVLFTLSKERSETRIRARWAFLKILLDGWQLFTCIVSPARQGWSINQDGMAWAVVGVLNFTWLADLGYGAYLAVLYAMLALLSVNVVMCVWVAWCFKEHKFPAVWPIKVLRLFSSLFFQAFDVTSLNLLQLGFSCRFTGPLTPHLLFSLFPQYSCTTSPHIIHAIVSALCLLLFVSIALLLNMAEVEVNPLSRRPLALGHSGADVWAFTIKVLLTLVNVFFGWKRVEASIYLALSLALAWLTLKWNSNLVAWMNYLKGGVSATTVWTSATLMMLVFRSEADPAKAEEWSDGITILMLAGLGPAFGAGALISWGILRYKTTSALKALENRGKLPLMDAFHSIDEPRDIEVASRCCRVWKDSATLDPDAVNKAHQIIKAGVEMFPQSAYMVLLHGNFMIDVLGISQSGSRRIEEARKLNPSLMCRFIMFVRQQQATQSAAETSVNSSSRMDLLGYVEYQRKQRMVVRLHKEALQAMCSFWKALDASNVSFTHLSKALGKIEVSVSQAQRAYQVVLGSYGNNPKLVYLYGKFLQTVKNDPWHAAAYISEAERLEELQAGQTSGPLMPDGTPLSRMDDLATAVLVMNAGGEVQMANKHAHALFGYKRGALEGMPFAALLAPHFTQRLAKRLAALSALHESEADPQDAGDPGGELVVGLHYDRLAFPARLILHKATGVGEDSTIVALVEPMPPAKGVASLWVTSNGLITACDGAFVAQFGWKASEVNGINIQALISCVVPAAAGAACSAAGGDQRDYMRAASKGVASAAGANAFIARLMSYQSSSAAAEGAGAAFADVSRQLSGGFGCHVPHKYTRASVACEISVVTKGAANDAAHAIYELWIRVKSAAAQILAVNRKGQILHASPEVAAILLARGSDGGIAAAAPRLLSGGRLDGGGLGAGGGFLGLAAVTPAGPAHNAFTGYTLTDFLSPAWKEMHTKFLKDMAPASGMPFSGQQPVVCRQSGGLPGPTLEMRSAGGRELYLRVGVTTTELGGEMVHLVRMDRSSLDAALAERRLRLRLSPDGLISAVESGDPGQLFGLEAGKLLGRGLWEILEELPLVGDEQPCAAGPHIATRFLERSLLFPCHSWRVQVVPPPPRTPGGANRGSLPPLTPPQQPKAAILQVEQSTRKDGGGGGSSDNGGVCVDLWPISCVVGVLELDPYGRIRAVLEERTRPAGLLFGLPSRSLLGSNLDEFLALPRGLLRPEDLLMPSAFKKSSLKSRSREASVKVGPVHVLRAAHQDGEPLSLEVQLVGKPGPNESATAILRIHTPPAVMMPRRPPPQSRPASAFPAAPGSPRSAVMIAGGASLRGARFAAVVASAASAAVSAVATATPAASPAPPAAAAPVRTPEQAAAATLLRPSADFSPHPAADAFLLEQQDSAPELGSDHDPLAAALSLSAPAAKRAGLDGSLTKAGMSPSQSPSDVGSGAQAPASAQLAGRSKLSELVKSLGEERPSISDRGVAACPRPALDTKPQRSRLLESGRRLTAGAAAGVEATAGSASVGAPSTPGQQSVLVPGAVATPPLNVEATLPVHDLDSVTAFGGGRDEVAPLEKSMHKMTEGRIYKWVATEGAFYQNSDDPDAIKRFDDGQPPAGDGEAQTTKDGGYGGLRLNSPPVMNNLLSPTVARDDSDPLLAAATMTKRVAMGRGGDVTDDSADDDNLPMMDGGGGADHDDAGSEGGHSALSGSATGSEYTRGKRVRKLTKLMDSSEAKQVQKRLRVRALLTVAALAIAHIVCFTLTVITVKSQQNAMVQLGRSSQVQLNMHRVMLGVRSLDNIAMGKWHRNFYTPDDVPYFIEDIGYHAGEAMARLDEILGDHSRSPVIMDLLYQSKKLVWESNDANGSDVYSNLTILDFGTRFFAMSKNFEQHYDGWVKSGIRAANTTAGQFIIKSGPDFFKEFRKVMDALLEILVDSARRVEYQQIIFLVVEGAALSFLAACYLAYLLRAVAAQRCKLYNTFLIIPLGLTRALASQSTHNMLDGEEDSDDDEDEEEKAGQMSAGQLHLDSDFPNNNSTDPQKIRRRATLKLQQEAQASSRPAAGLGGGASAWEGHLGMTSGRVQGNRHSGANAADPRAARRGGGGEDHISGQTNGGRQQPHSLSGEPADHASAGCLGWLNTWRSRFWRSLVSRLRGRSVIHPISGSLSEQHGNGKRRLVLDSHETAVMLLAFILWSALVVTIYSVAVVMLKGIDEVVALHSIANFFAARVARTVLFSQELVSVDSPSQIPAKRDSLLAAMKLLRDIWFTLQRGANAYLSSGNDTERFPLVTKGLDVTSPGLLQQLYIAGACHRTGEDLPCLGLDYRFYKMAHGSMASILQQQLMSLKALAANTTNVPIGLQNDNFDFIYNVGYFDLLDGALTIKESHSDIIMAKFGVILLLHIVLFLLFWLIFAGFLLLQLNPLVKRVSAERRRVAELLAQLPLELDVERLVGRALGTSSSNAGAAAGGGTAPRTSIPGTEGAQNPSLGGNALNNQMDSDGIGKWKAIIRAGVSLNGKTPQQSTDGYRKRA